MLHGTVSNEDQWKFESKQNKQKFIYGIKQNKMTHCYLYFCWMFFTWSVFIPSCYCRITACVLLRCLITRFYLAWIWSALLFYDATQAIIGLSYYNDSYCVEYMKDGLFLVIEYTSAGFISGKSTVAHFLHMLGCDDIKQWWAWI